MAPLKKDEGSHTYSLRAEVALHLQGWWLLETAPIPWTSIRAVPLLFFLRKSNDCPENCWVFFLQDSAENQPI